MPNIISNAKSLKKDQKKRLFKISCKKRLKKSIKTSLENQDVSLIYKNLDSLCCKGIIKKNRCNKLKSHYMLQVSSLKK